MSLEENTTQDRLKLLELEKRLVELEMKIEDLNKRVSGVDLKNLKQRLEDVEDLVMIENAGVVELKKLLEEKLPKKLEEKTKELIEKNLSVPLPIIDEIKRLKSELILVKSELDSFVGVEEKIRDNLRELVYDKINNLRTEIMKLSSKVNSLEEIKTDVNDIKSYIRKLESRIEENRKLIAESPRVDDIKITLKNFEKSIEEKVMSLEDLKSQIFMNKSSIESLENLVGNLNSKILELQQLVEELNKIKEISSSDELESLQAKLSNIESLSDKLNNLSEEFSLMKVEMEKIKKDILQMAPISSVEELYKRLEEISKVLSPEFIKNLALKVSRIESKINAFEATNEKKVFPVIIE